ncbi:AI-2E family transporter [Agarivorans litoreus]|uniref:AI-2E family transporter n=1 Tax=Agarivorans litoreus TaxID=1510455 RepID=UPI001C7D29B9|nr:AI-2E family transporter [Agarivorans litoreus]
MNQTTSMRHGLVTAAALVVLLAGLKAATPVLIPFLMSMFIAIIASPIVNFLTRLRIPRVLSVMMVLLLIVCLIMLLAGVVGSSISDFRASIPVYREQLLVQLAGLSAFAAGFDIDLSMSIVTDYFDPGVILGLFANTLTGLSGAATNIFIILLVTIFMLLEADTMPQRMHDAIHNPDVRMSQVNKFLKAVNSYIAVKTMISLFTAIPITIVLSLLDLDYAILWGILAFLLNYIPNVGSLIAAVPPVLLALLQLGPSQALAVAGLYVGVNLVMGNIVEPRIMGKGLGLSSLVVVLSLIFWGWLFGSVGMLLSVPLTMIIKIGLESSNSGHWFSRILSHPDDLKKESEPVDEA